MLELARSHRTSCEHVPTRAQVRDLAPLQGRNPQLLPARPDGRRTSPSCRSGSSSRSARHALCFTADVTAGGASSSMLPSGGGFDLMSGLPSRWTHTRGAVAGSPAKRPRRVSPRGGPSPPRSRGRRLPSEAAAARRSRPAARRPLRRAPRPGSSSEPTGAVMRSNRPPIPAACSTPATRRSSASAVDLGRPDRDVHARPTCRGGWPNRNARRSAPSSPAAGCSEPTAPRRPGPRPGRCRRAHRAASRRTRRTR